MKGTGGKVLQHLQDHLHTTSSCAWPRMRTRSRIKRCNKQTNSVVGRA